MPNLRHLPLPDLPADEAAGREIYLRVRAEARGTIRRHLVRAASTAATVSGAAIIGVREDGFLAAIFRMFVEAVPA